MFIVDEYQTVKVTYVVDTETRRDAESAVKKHEDTVVEVTVHPEFIEVQRREIRPVTDNDMKDYMIQRGVQFLHSSIKEPQVKLGRPKKQ